MSSRRHLFVVLCYASHSLSSLSFFFTDTATTEIYTLSLHDALPICGAAEKPYSRRSHGRACSRSGSATDSNTRRSEEHTSELQSPDHLVCRLLLEKKKKQQTKKKIIIYALKVTICLTYTV